MSTKRTLKFYDSEFKAQAVKLAQEIGGHKIKGCSLEISDTGRCNA